MVEESNQNVFWIQIEASSFAEFEIHVPEFEISRVDCSISASEFSQMTSHNFMLLF